MRLLAYNLDVIAECTPRNDSTAAIKTAIYTLDARGLLSDALRSGLIQALGIVANMEYEKDRPALGPPGVRRLAPMPNREARLFFR